MRQVLCGDALSPAGREHLLGWLRACETGKDRLRAGLPQGWAVGDKTGSGPRCAIIFKSPTTNMTTTNGYQGRLLDWSGQRFSSATTGDAMSVQAMKSWFGGAAVSVGCMGNAVELLAAGAGYAAHSVNTPTNTGFFRDEGTVLLVFTLTDEHDHSPAPLAQYHDMLTSIKSGCGGDACIITGGLLNPYCATSGKKIWDFLNMFGEPTKWAPIADDAEYTKVLAEALLLLHRPAVGCAAYCSDVDTVAFTFACLHISGDELEKQFQDEVKWRAEAAAAEGIHFCPGADLSTFLTPCGVGIIPQEWPGQDHAVCTPAPPGCPL